MTLSEILSIIEKSQDNRATLSKHLKTMMKDRRTYYQLCQEIDDYNAYSSSLFKALLLELDEEENDSIESAELAYLSLCKAITENKNQGNNMSYHDDTEMVKRRLLLLHYFSDYFADSIIEIFLNKYRKENMLEARKLALECLEKMQLADIAYLDDNYHETTRSDQQITDAANSISIEPVLSDDEMEEAKLLHKILHSYLHSKYKK